MPPKPRSSMPSAALSQLPAHTARLRISQRPPTACRECSQRKVRCDKQTPCGRCFKMGRPCTREIVRITKSLSVHRDELIYLRGLRAKLLRAGASCQDAVVDIDERIRFLEHGKSVVGESEAELTEPEPETETEPEGGGGPLNADGGGDCFPCAGGVGVATPGPLADLAVISGASAPLRPDTTGTSATTTSAASTTATSSAAAITSASSSSSSGRAEPGSVNNDSILAAFEFLAWGRNSQTCFPHRRCRCYEHRPYPELVSINSDATWGNRVGFPVTVDPDLHLPPDVAACVIQFHMDHLRWHHNALHAPTFLDRCQQFWSTNTVDHPLWLALYYAVSSVSLWALRNNAAYRSHVVSLAGSYYDEALLSEDLVHRQFQAMLTVLYENNFLENLSLYSVQAIVISTRIAHNLDRSDLNATLIGAAVRIAHCLGLHKISDPPETAAAGFDWRERVEVETGKRVWLQLLIQDHFQIPFTDTYIIHPNHFTTPLPRNCNDEDMIERHVSVPTNSSYTRMLSRKASLIPGLLDGLGPLGARRSPAEIYPHILSRDRAMRANVAKIPEFLLREPASVPSASSSSAATATNVPSSSSPSSSSSSSSCILWLPLARRTLAISAAEKIIMIHRPVLFYSFQSPVFRQTRTTCVAAAVTILREHELAVAESAISIWTHSAFAVTAAVVLGLELFHRLDHTDTAANSYRHMMARAADRLRHRACDAMAKRGALLIDTLLAAEEDLVLRMMRGSSGGNGSGAGATGAAFASIEEYQRSIINDMIGSHEILARFLAVAPPPQGKMTTAAAAAAASASVSSPVTGGGGQIYGISPRTPMASIPLASAGVGVPLGTALPPMDIETSQDFNVWFSDVFGPPSTTLQWQ